MFFSRIFVTIFFGKLQFAIEWFHLLLLYFSLPCLEIASPRCPPYLKSELWACQKCTRVPSKRPKAEGTTTTNTHTSFSPAISIFIFLSVEHESCFSLFPCFFLFSRHAPLLLPSFWDQGRDKYRQQSLACSCCFYSFWRLVILFWKVCKTLAFPCLLKGH